MIPEGELQVQAITRDELAQLPTDVDWYLTDKAFTWTYVHTHQPDLGPFFCRDDRR